jgi:hypothetical protein
MKILLFQPMQHMTARKNVKTIEQEADFVTDALSKSI